MQITKKSKWKNHSLHLGVQIYKRIENSGSASGHWRTLDLNCKSLAQAKRQIENQFPQVAELQQAGDALHRAMADCAAFHALNQ